MQNDVSALILAWFDQHGRKDLPWQKPLDPYRVWVSEIMLQQTQVKTVIPYFERFINRFPTISPLASAAEEEVLALWAGLGYYARARNLHKTAKIIQQEFHGQFPSALNSLQKLPGIGRSTAGAILAIAGGQKAAILDGNVKRVLTRLHGIAGWPGETKVLQQLWEIAERYTPAVRVAEYTQAVMDLGATVCAKKPQCLHCPLNQLCYAYKTHTVSCYPAKKAKLSLRCRSTTMIVLQYDTKILLKKRPAPGIWGGLWSFPESDIPLGSQDAKLLNGSCRWKVPCAPKRSHKSLSSATRSLFGSRILKWNEYIEPEKILVRDLIAESIYQEFGCKISEVVLKPPFRHTFSHFHLDIMPLVAKVAAVGDCITENDQFMWYCLKQDEPAIPKPVKRILSELKQEMTYGA